MPYEHGDYVIYIPTGRLGRVARPSGDGYSVVCYSMTGCNGCLTSDDDLRAATATEVANDPNQGHIGYHRFDATCPRYDPEACSYYCPDKEVSR